MKYYNGDTWMVSTPSLLLALEQVQHQVYYAWAVQDVSFLEQMLQPAGWHVLTLKETGALLPNNRHIVDAYLHSALSEERVRMRLLLNTDAIRINCTPIPRIPTKTLELMCQVGNGDLVHNLITEGNRQAPAQD